MTKHYHTVRFFLSPIIMIAAVMLFILDCLHINVTPLVSYMLKESV